MSIKYGAITYAKSKESLCVKFWSKLGNSSWRLIGISSIDLEEVEETCVLLLKVTVHGGSSCILRSNWTFIPKL